MAVIVYVGVIVLVGTSRVYVRACHSGVISTLVVYKAGSFGNPGSLFGDPGLHIAEMSFKCNKNKK